MNIKAQLQRDQKELFFQTPLWYLDSLEWSWLKNSDYSSLKRLLMKPNTPFGIGKIIELSLYPQTTAVYSIVKTSLKDDITLSVLHNLLNNNVTLISEDSSRFLFSLKDSVAPTPEDLEQHLKTFWLFKLNLFSPKIIADSLAIEESKLVSYIEPLTFEKGLSIEALSE